MDQGGYRKPDYWKQPFVKDGRTLSWEDAMGSFQDATGRPGPATWELGTYPDGQGEYPVGGVSWFEAAAYAEFAGKALPTFYHWYKATDIGAAVPVRRHHRLQQLPRTRTGGRGNPRRDVTVRQHGHGGQRQGVVRHRVGPRAVHPRRRLGRAGSYVHPSRRGCPRGPGSPSTASGACGTWRRFPARLAAPVEWAWRDYSAEKPVSDEAFRSYRSFYAYDRTDLKAAVEAVEEAEHWRHEKVSFDAAYGNERVPAHLFLPRNARPPYQTIVFYPTGEA